MGNFVGLCVKYNVRYGSKVEKVHITLFMWWTERGRDCCAGMFEIIRAGV